ncbi:MAG: cbb3-type cytochrome c oxidase N-terminal domain-containing protein [Agriterribacter sp.]
MLLAMQKKRKYIFSGLAVLVFAPVSQVCAEGNNTAGGTFSNPVTDILLVLMLLLLIVIATLGKLLIDLAEVKLKKEKKQSEANKAAGIVTALLLFCSATAFAQTENAVPASDKIAGMSSFAFYTMMTVIFIELFVILGVLFNIRSLLRAEKEKTAILTLKKPTVSWWTKMNRFKPVEQEADIDLGHDYDGIRELDNRLPPWWLYGFYVTIIVAIVYLWRFHVSHTGLSGKEEYEVAVANAELEIKAYLEKKGDAVDENNVTVLAAADDIAAGKAIFLKSCAACHKETGAGDVGPNLTDNYWLHGGDIKSIFKTIRYGINAMPQWQTSYSNKQIAQVAGFVTSLKGSNPANPKPPQGILYGDDASAAASADSSASKNEPAVKP